ncbi:MAG: hypothetical protein R3B09_28770 [Nannocystaceae bacterium]
MPSLRRSFHVARAPASAMGYVLGKIPAAPRGSAMWIEAVEPGRFDLVAGEEPGGMTRLRVTLQAEGDGTRVVVTVAGLDFARALRILPFAIATVAFGFHGLLPFLGALAITAATSGVVRQLHQETPKHRELADAFEVLVGPVMDVDDLLRSMRARRGERTTMRLVDESIGTVGVEVLRDFRPITGGFLVAKIRPPDLAIGLSLDETRGALRSRDPAQASWLAEAISGVLDPFDLSSACDRALTIELPEPDRDEVLIRRLTIQARALARRLDEVLADLPPPAALASRVPEWSRAAARLGARLRPGDLALLGGDGTRRFSVVTEWDHRGEAVGLVLELVVGFVIGERFHLHWCRMDGSLPASALSLETAAEGAWILEIDATALRLVARGPQEPAWVVARLEALQAVADRLDGRLGVYR